MVVLQKCIVPFFCPTGPSATLYFFVFFLSPSALFSLDSFPSTLMSMSSTQTYKPKVLIVGAGIGGISLVTLLEKAGIPYQVFERTSEMKFLGKRLRF